MVWFRMWECRVPSAQEYNDFLRRARLKAYQATGGFRQIGNYLEILR